MGNGNGRADTPDRPATDDNNSQKDEDMVVDENENSYPPAPEEDHQDQLIKEADIIDDVQFGREEKSEQVKQSNNKTDKENVLRRDTILTNPFIYPKPSTNLPVDRPAFLFKPGVLEQAFSHGASSSRQSEPPRSGIEDHEEVGSEDGHGGEDTPIFQPDIQHYMEGADLPENKHIEEGGAVDKIIGLHNEFPLVDEIQDIFEEEIEVARQTQAKKPLGNEDGNCYKKVPQTPLDQPNRVQDLLGTDDSDEEEPVVAEPQSHILLDNDGSAAADLRHDKKVDEIAVSDNYNSKSPCVQLSEGEEGETVQAEDKDKNPTESQYEEIVVVDIIEELPLDGNEKVIVLPNAEESPDTAPVTTTTDIFDIVDDIFEASTSGLPVPVDTSDSDDDDAFSLLELADSHLQCPICMEVFIVPTTINCGHTFCQDCIQDWKKKHKLCPYCRTRIKIMVTSNAMDQFITEMFGLLDEEGLERRREFARQREENKNKKKKK